MVYPRLVKATNAEAAPVCTLKSRINLLVGPPSDPERLPEMMGCFFSEEGKHVVCGGTTSILAAEFLHKPLETLLPGHLDPVVPPVARIDGVDLVTEGFITIGRVLEYARNYRAGTASAAPWNTGEDGASKIARILLEEAEELTLYVGGAVNPAYQAGEIVSGYRDKIGLLKELESCLRNRGKPIQVHYF
ncbi:MAG: hypothetical protein LBG24_08970 [Treponema sp.]|jgi:hypothetical protein|nr:hypothetical protein [Treponema sp.]